MNAPLDAAPALGTPTRSSAARHFAPSWAALGLAAVSGAAGLGYELVWIEQLGTWLGKEFVAVLAVVAAFFGGLALGAQTLAQRIEQSERPALWYAACEATIGAWALVLSWLLPRAAEISSSWIGTRPHVLLHWAVAFLGPFVLLAPATAALGATLPALERTLSRASREGFSIGALYAANTLGAVLGVYAFAFIVIPMGGLERATRLCAALNLGCAALAFALGRRQRALPAAPAAPRSNRKLWLLLTWTGALGIGYEVLVVRVLAQRTENTVYTFAILLGAYLLGTAGGGALYQRWLAARAADGARLRDRLLAATATLCLSGVLVLRSGASWNEPVARLLRESLGDVPAALLGEAVLAAAAFLPATVAMGALFSALCVESKRSGIALGTAVAANTLGAALAPATFGVVLLPTLGPNTALLVVIVGYLALVRPAAWRTRNGVLAAAALAVPSVAVFLSPPLTLADVPRGGRLLHHDDGVAATVSVLEDVAGVRSLRINNRQREGSDATVLADARQAWLPLLLHPKAERALFLGLGTGITAGSAAWDPDLEVDAVELLPEVVRAVPFFAPALQSARAPRLIVADARRYVRSDASRYDVIVADLFHPARSGAGSLYTVEHFSAVRARLAPGGRFCQWLALHQLDLETLSSIVQAFLSVYPNATALLATNSLDTPVLGLLGGRDAEGVSVAVLRERRTRLAPSARLDALQLDDELAILGSFFAGPRALRNSSFDLPPNSDDRPIVARRAPLATYAPGLPPRGRLLAILDLLAVEPPDVLRADDPENVALAPRLVAYWAARDRFLELGARTQPSSDARTMLERIGAPLLDILRTSPDFRPAYDPLLNIAQALSARDPRAARKLLSELAVVQPARPEASRLLAALARATDDHPP